MIFPERVLKLDALLTEIKYFLKNIVKRNII